MTRQELQPVLDGEPRAVRSFIREQGPYLLAEVRRVRAAWHRPTLEEDDLLQEVFIALFKESAHALRGWDPEKGRSLRTYLRQFARMRTIDQLKRGGAHFREAPMEDQALTGAAEGQQQRGGLARPPQPDEQMHAAQLLKEAQQSCSPDEATALEWMLEDRAVPDIVRDEGLQAAAVHQRRHRLRQRLQRLWSPPQEPTKK